jgi:hypothetical protein
MFYCLDILFWLRRSRAMNYWIKPNRYFLKKNLQLKFLGKKWDVSNLEEICKVGGFTRNALSI